MRLDPGGARCFRVEQQLGLLEGLERRGPVAALDRLEVGGVVVNEVPGFRSDVMPYGGVKDSGVGREGPRFAIEELTVTRMAVIRPTTTKL